MKAVAAVPAGLAGLVTAAAGAGGYALAVLGMLLLAGLAATCWVVTNRARTRNAVDLIVAARSRPTPPPAAASARRRQRTES